jgi:hypothetical protein
MTSPLPPLLQISQASERLAEVVRVRDVARLANEPLLSEAGILSFLRPLGEVFTLSIEELLARTGKLLPKLLVTLACQPAFFHSSNSWRWVADASFQFVESES